MKLSNASLAYLPKEVAVPAYDRSRLSAGIVHIGVGNFHRAHMARYTSDLSAKGLDPRLRRAGHRRPARRARSRHGLPVLRASPHMTVRNMGFALRLAGVPKAERDRKVEAAVQAVGENPTRVHDRLDIAIGGQTCHLFKPHGAAVERARRHPLADIKDPTAHAAA